MSGTDCLNLNITVPDIQSKTLLPVMVFVHGGGFIMGANDWPQYDSSRLVKLSVELKSPIIVVNINYRLGILGNLTSEEGIASALLSSFSTNLPKTTATAILDA